MTINSATPQKPSIKQRYFVTGTDTNVGKTFVTALLLARASQQGYTCYGLKPVTSGCITNSDGTLVSQDAEQLKLHASVKLHDDLVAPIKLPDAIAPHLAAAAVGQSLQASRLVGFIRGALSTPATHILIEGAGGWCVPINARETMADVAKQLGFDVILVVGMRLGCINHALLTVAAIARDGLKLAGWVANCVDGDLDALDDQITTLKQRIHAPCLGIIPQMATTLPMDIEVVRWPDEVVS